MTIRLAVLTMLLVASLASTAWAHHGGIPTLRNYGTAVVDGVISPGEYGADPPYSDVQLADGVGCWETTAYLYFDPSQTYNARLCVSNDADTSYYAFAIDDLTGPQSPWNETGGVQLYFDNEHDGSTWGPSPWQDMLWAQDGFFEDDAFNQWGFLESEPQNGTAMTVFTPGQGVVFEMAHPLASGDPDDYQLATYDTVGFCATYFDSKGGTGSAVHVHPFDNACYVGGYNPDPADEWGDIVVASDFDQFLHKLRSLVDSCFPCPLDVRRALEERVDVAFRAYDAGDERSVAGAMRSFVDATEGFVAARALSADEGRRLSAAARDVIAVIEGQAPHA